MTTPDFRRPRPRRGQSLIELTLLFATLLIIFSGLVEFGFWMLEYSNLVVAARNAGRFALDDDYRFTEAECTPLSAPTPTPACFTGAPAPCLHDFYCKAASIARDTLAKNQPAVMLNPTTDDIVISVFTLTEGRTEIVTNRHPQPHGYWSLFGNYSSRFTDEEIRRRITTQGVEHTSTGFVLVEIFYNYHHKLGLPWITVFVPNPLLLHAYTFMPLFSASPTPTP